MTPSDIIARCLPALRRMFPKELPDWSLEEYIAAQKAMRKRMWLALRQSLKLENEPYPDLNTDFIL
jgi:hypothetical protein